MLRLLSVLAVVGAISASTVCEQYVECLAGARSKSLECSKIGDDFLHGKTATQCEDAKTEHKKLLELVEEKAAAHDKCISDKAGESVPEFTGKKKEKCDKLSANLAAKSASSTPKSDEATTSSSTETSTEAARVKRAAQKKGKKGENGHKQCMRDARAQRAKCASLAKCCPASKECQNAGSADFKKEIIAARSELKDKVRSCKAATHKEKKEQKAKAKILKAERKSEKKEKKEKKGKNSTTTTASPSSSSEKTKKA